MFENYLDCLLNDKIVLKSQQRFKSDYHNVYTEQLNKTALSNNDDKRLQTFDKISSIQNTNNLRFRIWKSKCIIKFNKQSVRY